MRKWMLAVCLAACALLLPAQAFATTIVVDAGHGGSDPGAIGIGGLREKDVTLDIATRLNAELRRRGYQSILSRTDDRYISLQGRVDFTNEHDADLFVSVHANWYSRSAARGTMVLYYDDAYPQESYPASAEMKALAPKSRALAQSVLDAFIPAAGTTNLGLTPSSVYVVRMGKVPSILVETAFLSNRDDAALLTDDGERTRMALGIADGIQAWMPPVFPDLAGHWAKDAVLRLKQKAIVDGRSDDRFAPDDSLTRAEFVTMLDRVFAFTKKPAAGVITCKAGTVTGAVYGSSISETILAGTAVSLGSPGGGSTAATGGSGLESGCNPASPKDLPATHWAFMTMTRALSSGLLDGYADGTVRPDRPISREEVAVLLDRLIGGTDSATPDSGFADVPSGTWSAAPIARLKAKGIVDGVSVDRFAPERPVSRAEISVMLDRYLSKK